MVPILGIATWLRIGGIADFAKPGIAYFGSST